jgi:hypothetical protein
MKCFIKNKLFYLALLIFYGADLWFAGHRNDQSGLSNPYTQDITNYKNAINWIESQLASDTKYLSDDTRFWVSVPAI